MSAIKMVHQTHACGEGCGCGKGKNKTVNKKPQVDLAELAASVRAITERVKRLCAPSLAQQVESELKNHPGVGALVNEETGKVATFLAPKPYFALSPEERTALETERDELIGSLPRLPWTQRIRASSRIRAIEGDLGRDRAGREAERRDVERENERRRQRYGGE